MKKNILNAIRQQKDSFSPVSSVKSYLDTSDFFHYYQLSDAGILYFHWADSKETIHYQKNCLEKGQLHQMKTYLHSSN